MDRAIGQMVMTGFRGTALDGEHPFLRQLRAVPPGFVALFDVDVAQGKGFYNIESPAQLLRLVSDVQARSGEPILFALDQEGGRVARLKPERGFPASESAKRLGAKNDPALTHRLAASSARAMREAGVYLNLAPVVDLDLNPANPIIGGKERSYSASPDIVVSHAAEFIRAHHENGILCTLKHFPGQGSALKDTHVEFVDATSEWQEVELEPFRRLSEMGLADAVMTTHVFDANLDREWPASLSGAIIGGILRERFAYGGVVITDDLQMSAISGRYGLETVILRAIEAGADVLTFANNVVDADPEILARVVSTIRQLVRQGVIPPSRIEASVERIRRLKARAGSSAMRRETMMAVPAPATGEEEIAAHAFRATRRPAGELEAGRRSLVGR
jgi:beta-N-acetylhexosaminidase